VIIPDYGSYGLVGWRLITSAPALHCSVLETSKTKFGKLEFSTIESVRVKVLPRSLAGTDCTQKLILQIKN